MEIHDWFAALLIAAGVLAAASELGLLRLARRRLERAEDASLFALCAPLAPLGVLAITGLWIHTSRALFLHFEHTADAVLAELRATLWGPLCATPAIVLACWVVSRSLRTRLATVLGAAGLAFAPLFGAAAASALGKLQAYEALAYMESWGNKEAAFLDAQRVARSTLERGLWASAAGTLAAVVWLWPKLHVPARALPLALGASVAALALGLGSLPLRRELGEPWPPGTRAGFGASISVPALEGPDPLDPMPLFEITREHLRLDRVSLDSEQDVRAQLDTARRNHALLHPGEPALDRLLIACAPDAPRERWQPVLVTLGAAGYRNLTFAFEARNVARRPVLGDIELRRVSGARVALQNPAAPAQIDLRDASSCADLSQRIVHARRGAAVVALRW